MKREALPNPWAEDNARDDALAAESARIAEAQAAQQPTPAPEPKDDYATTTATTPAEARKEQHAEAVRQIRSGDTADAADAALYGIARGGTLGFSDRLYGLGAKIGDVLGGGNDPNAYQTGRTDYLENEDIAAKDHPIAHFAGEVAGGALPGIAASPLKFAGRFGNPAVLGAAAGAGNTRSDKPLDILTGAGIGAGTGLAAEGALGTVARAAIRKAPVRQENAVVRDIMESDAGRATPTTGAKLARDIDDVRSVLREDQDLSRAMRQPATDARKVVSAKVQEARVGQDTRYAEVDQALKKNPLTVTQLLSKLAKAEEDVPDKRLSLVKKGLKSLRDSIREDFAPRWSGDVTWNGQRTPLTTEQLRSWVSSVQATAEAAMGGINGTNAYKVPTDLAKIANGILEERLDLAASKGAGEAVKAIRESDRKTSALLNIDRALEDRERKELAQSVGLNKRMGSAIAHTAAPALALSGHVAPAAAVAAQGTIKKMAGATAREINDRLLAPLQRAAEAGASWAEVSRMAAESGMPQSVARAVYERKQASAGIPAGYKTSTDTGL